MRPSNDSKPLRRWRRIGFPLAAILLGLLPFLALEVGLRLFDVGRPSGYVDPLVGFGRKLPLFVRDAAGEHYETALARSLSFGRQQFLAAKPAGGFRLFCLGGSTVRGRPFDTDTSLTEWMRIELAGADANTNYEVVNCGGVSYASYRLMPILEEVLQHEPDAIVVATGHNEFLEDRSYTAIKSRSAARAWLEDRLLDLRSVTLARGLWASSRERIGSDSGKTLLPDDVDARLDDVSGYASYHRDDRWRRDVLAHYELTLRAMVRACRDAGVPLILVNLGANLRDSPPFKSQHRPGMTAQEDVAWQMAFAAATEVDEVEPQRALELYRRAEMIDAEYAVLNFRIARVLDRLGRHAEAKANYIAAKDHDICPLRMLEQTHEILRTVAEKTRTPLVDVRRAIEVLSPEGIPGNDWFVDHVHPSIGGHQQIAGLVADALRQNHLLPSPVKFDRVRRRAAYRRHLRGLHISYFNNGRRRIGWLERWARRARLSQEMVPRDGHGHLRLGHRWLELGDADDAWQEYRAAVDLEASAARDVIDHAFRLFEEGRTTVARELVRRLGALDEAADFQAELLVAAIVLAVEEGDLTDASKLYQTHRDALAQADSAPIRWLSISPATGAAFPQLRAADAGL